MLLETVSTVAQSMSAGQAFQMDRTATE